MADVDKGGTAAAAPPAGRVAVKLRLHVDTKARVGYWASRADMSDNEYMTEAIEEKIARENGDFNVPSLIVQRINEMIDRMGSLTVAQNNLQRVCLDGFGSITGLARGDDYLLDDDDGELVEGHPHVPGAE